MHEIYVNSFAKDMQQRLSHYGNISVFPEMSFGQIARAVAENRIQIPSIILAPLCGWTTQQCYTTLSPNNQWIQRPFDLNTFPLRLGIVARILAPDPQSALNIGNIITNMYSNAISLAFQHPYFPQERIVIPYASGSAKGDPKFIEAAGIYVMQVEARRSELAVPCFFNQESFQLIGQSRPVEVELLSFAAVCSIYSCAQTESLMQSKYRYLVSPQKLGRRESGKVSPQLKAMRKSYESGAQVDPNVFRQEFNTLLCMIPDLYQRAMMREPYETTFSIFQNAATQYRARKDWICDHLGIPPHLDLNIDPSNQPREITSLTHMTEAMIDDEDMHVADAYNTYLETMRAQSAQIDQMVDFATNLAYDHVEKKIDGLDLGNSTITGVAQDILRNKFMK